MDSLELALTGLGIAVGIISLWKTSKDGTARFWQAIALIFVAALALYGGSYKAEVERLNSIARQATTLLKENRGATSEGFILSAMTFLEGHKDEFPDTYQRAITICKNHGCLESENKRDNRLEHGWDQVNVKYAFRGLLHGIAVMNEDSREGPILFN